MKMTDEDAAEEAAMARIVERINAGECPECGETPQYIYQVHQAMYCHPCNHRVGVGNARKKNERHGYTAPESAHTDPDGGLYSDWAV